MRVVQLVHYVMLFPGENVKSVNAIHELMASLASPLCIVGSIPSNFVQVSVFYLEHVG